MRNCRLDLFKKAIFLGFFGLHLNLGFAQMQDSIYTTAEMMPYFQGCAPLKAGSPEKRTCSNKLLANFLAQNLILPQNDAEGTVYVSFVVDETGDLIEPKIIRGISWSHDSAALSVLKRMPKWEAGKDKGQNIKFKWTLPIRFAAKKDESAGDFKINWGTLTSESINKDALKEWLNTPITVRDEKGNVLEINELVVEREHEGKFSEVQAISGKLTAEQMKLIKKLKTGDILTFTVTVQRGGRFLYSDKSFKIN
jgi:Gram-negative bacterial TonB protein C-terminal